MTTASVNLEYGNLHPFDVSAGDPTDWAHSAARGIVAMLQDNADIVPILEAMDEQTATDFVAGLADIIREAEAQDTGEETADATEATPPDTTG